MQKPRRAFETRGPVDPSRHYVVPRTAEVADLTGRIKDGRYIVIFAPRQTGKTTFFRWTLEKLADADETYFPIQLDFQPFKEYSVEIFYSELHRDIQKSIIQEFDRRQSAIAPDLQHFLDNYQLTEQRFLEPFLEELNKLLGYRKVAIIIDEFDGIPPKALTGFLHTLRRIYQSRKPNRCPHSVGIVGVKNISQLNYDRSISPFNIQDDLLLPNFTIAQVQMLFEQYKSEVGQSIATDVVKNIYRQTAGQPFLVNRFAQILTEELEISLDEPITHGHFESAHKEILRERNTHIMHLTTNIRKDRRFESLLMRIALRERPVAFNYDNEIISELSSFGVLVPDADWNCQIQNPIYQYRIVRAFQPVINGLEDEFLPEDTEAGFYDYVASDRRLNMRMLLNNFTR